MTGISIELEVLVPLFVGIAAGLIAAIILKILKDSGWRTLLGVAVIFFVIGAVVAWLFIPNHLVEVPDIVGYSEGDAERIIEGKDLVFNIIDRTDSNTVQKYKIISQDPQPGLRVKKDSVINVVISTGGSTLTPIIQITILNDGDLVPWRYTVKGTSNITPNSEFNIYVLIHADKWYAQPKAYIFPDGEGEWETESPVRFGGPDDSGKGYTYDVCAIVTTQDFEVDESFTDIPDYYAKSKKITVIRE